MMKTFTKGGDPYILKTIGFVELQNFLPSEYAQPFVGSDEYVALFAFTNGIYIVPQQTIFWVKIQKFLPVKSAQSSVTPTP